MNSIKQTLNKGGIAVLRTDTLYGIVADAFNEEAVQKVYEAKERNRDKACIVLVADYDQIERFGVTLSPSTKDLLDQYWPGKVSILLPVNSQKETVHIHRGTGEIAFRIPNNESLRLLLRNVGPLIAPSANKEGMPPAQSISEAQAYFGDLVDWYEDGGEVVDMTPSTLIRINTEGKVETLR